MEMLEIFERFEEAVILCVGGTPAMQRTLFFERFVPGEVNRAREVVVTASGKVTNAARVAATLGGRVVFVSFLGGESGRFVARRLDEEGGVTHDAVWTEASTRTCTTLIHDEVTELVEEAEPVSPEEAAALRESSRKHLSGALALCLIGSLPPGVPDDLYATLVEAANREDVPTLVDAQKVPLRRVLEASPFIVKPNLEEAIATLGLSKDATSTEAALSLVEAGARWALVSDGAEGSSLADDAGETWRIESPTLAADGENGPLNPIGSGDSLAAGLLYALAKGSSVPQSAVYGTACAAANVLTPTSGVVRPPDVERLLRRVRISPV